MKPSVPLKVFAVNSSPRTGGASKTELMLNHLVTGMREAGAEAEVVNLRKKRIHKDVTIVAEIYRSASEALTSPGLEEIAKDVLKATIRAGRELVESMRISPDTMARIRQPIVDPEQYTQLSALFWESCIAAGVTPKEFHDKKMVPRPGSLESFMAFFAIAINSDAVGEQRVTLQFHFSGETADSCYFVITKDKIDAEKGTAADPDLVIDTPFQIWMDILTRKADGQRLFLEQKYHVTGDLDLMIQLFQQAENG